jgi:hypothetical protein
VEHFLNPHTDLLHFVADVQLYRKYLLFGNFSKELIKETRVEVYLCYQSSLLKKTSNSTWMVVIKTNP